MSAIDPGHARRSAVVLPLVLGLVGVLGIPGTSVAQTCAGLAPFAGRPLQIGGGVTAGSGITTGALDVAVGGRVWFAGAEADWTHYQDVDASAPAVGGEAGADLRVGSTERVFVCPIVSVFATFGPTVSGVTFRDLQTALTGSLGIVAGRTGNLTWVPTMAVSAVVDHASATLGSVEESETSGFGVVQVGLGLVFSSRVALLPTAQFPVHLEGARPQGSLAFRVSF